MKKAPALDFRTTDVDLLYAALDDFSPTALEEHADGLRAFFLTAADRDAAHLQLSTHFRVARIDVPDDDWARRSQEGLNPVTVGRLTIVPNQESKMAARPEITNESAIRNPQCEIELVISPSMGFGTGHHATTRLCLDALQRIDLAGKTILDVGTGSGVLAIAARVLGAARTIGIDFDPDAIQSARDNLALNADVSNVSFIVQDLGTASLEPADVVTANLTGALLVRSAATLLAATKPGGLLIMSGLLAVERDAVVNAFRSGTVIWDRQEAEWVGLSVKKP